MTANNSKNSAWHPIAVALAVTALVLLCAVPSSDRPAPQRPANFTSLTGSIGVGIAEDFEKAPTYTYYLLQPDKKPVPLHLSFDSSDLKDGRTVQIDGVARADGSFEAASIVPLGDDSGGTDLLSAPPQTPKKVALILMNFANNPSQPFTPQQGLSAIFSGADSTRAYFEETLQNLMPLRGHHSAGGDVYGWYTIPYSPTPYDPNVYCPPPAANACNTSNWANTAENAAGAQGFVRSNYDFVILVWPRTCACDWSGNRTWGSQSEKLVLINRSNSLTDIAHVADHEIGHHLGLNYHSSTVNCTNSSGGRVSISSTCTTDEYGDPFDMMGGIIPSTMPPTPTPRPLLQYFPRRQLSATHLNQIKISATAPAGIFEASNVQVVTSNGTYAVVPLELPSLGVKLLRVFRYTDQYGGDHYFDVEFRQPFGTFDNFAPTDPVVNGISIRIADKSPFVTQLIDTTPETPSFLDAPLTVGKSLYDPIKGVTIKLLSVSPSGVSVWVKYGFNPVKPYLLNITEVNASQY